jgi:outer membrane protein assembly factor BamB
MMVWWATWERRIKRYYNGVLDRRTTRCCSALALAAALVAPETTRAAKKSDGPLPFWPVRTQWTLALNNQLTYEPAFDDTRAFFPLEHDRLVAYDVARGERLWTIDAAMWSAPVAGGGFVFFVDGGGIAAVRAADGSAAWHTPLDDEVVAAPVWASGWLVVATTDGTVIALRAEDGHEIWRRDLGVPVHAPPAISGAHVYLPLDDSRIVALQIETGVPLWDRKLGGAPNEILALDDRLFVGATDSYFYCVTTDEGRVDWRWRAGAEAVGMPAVDEQRVYFASLDNVVRALNRSNGVQQWIQLLKFRPTGGPLRAGATVIVYGQQPPLRAFNAADGKGGGDISAAGLLAGAPFLVAADEGAPSLIVVTRDIAKGDTVARLTRSVEPQATPVVPLPNPLTAVPVYAGAPGA